MAGFFGGGGGGMMASPSSKELPIQMSDYGEALHAELNSVSIGLPPNEIRCLIRKLLESECRNSDPFPGQLKPLVARQG